MWEAAIAVLCIEAREGRIFYHPHYAEGLFARDQPSRQDTDHLLYDDSPEVIEQNEELPPRRRSLLIWGIMDYGRQAHLLCVGPPQCMVITAYWPDTEPYKWTLGYKRRVP